MTKTSTPLPSATPKPLLTMLAAPHVVLKIRRRKFKRTFKAGEIAITRRLFRSGESEYLLNGKLCRLRDIQDIFMGTGLGPESYAIIEQGRIGQILSSKPTDRRAIIEEAAGITKFKTRKRLAEARLEDAKQNLARINDIFDEVTRQMNSLKRQAVEGRALCQAARRDARQAARACWPASSRNSMPKLPRSSRNSPKSAKRCTRRARPCSRWKPSTASARSAAMPSSAKSQENREQLNTLALEIDRAAARRRTNEERCAELDARSAGSAGRDRQHRRAARAAAAGAGSQSRHAGVGQRRCRRRAAGVAAAAAGSCGCVGDR